MNDSHALMPLFRALVEQGLHESAAAMAFEVIWQGTEAVRQPTEFVRDASAYLASIQESQGHVDDHLERMEKSATVCVKCEAFWTLQGIETLWAQAEINQETASVMYDPNEDAENYGRPATSLPVAIREAVMQLTGDDDGAWLPEKLGGHRATQIAMSEYWGQQTIRPLPEAQ